jgi:hypothetical protein
VVARRPQGIDELRLVGLAEGLLVQVINGLAVLRALRPNQELSGAQI